MDKFLPLMLNLKGRKILVVGGGGVASRKVDALRSCEGEVLVVSPTLTPHLTQLLSQGEIQYHQGRYHLELLKGCALCFACTKDADTNRQIGEDCRQRGTLFSRVDDQEDMDFFLPAHFSRGNLTIAVSTEGGSPALAKEIKAQLEHQFPPIWEQALEKLQAARENIKQSCPDEQKRRELLKALGGNAVLKYVEARDIEGLDAWIAGQLQSLS